MDVREGESFSECLCLRHHVDVNVPLTQCHTSTKLIKPGIIKYLSGIGQVYGGYHVTGLLEESTTLFLPGTQKESKLLKLLCATSI